MSAFFLLGSEGLREVASFLPSVVDVYNFFSVCATVCFCDEAEKDARADVLRQTFLRNLARGLTPFNVSVEKLLNAMYYDDAAISGGFALQCVTGEFNERSDVDIFSFLTSSEQPVTDVLACVANVVSQSGYTLKEVADNQMPIKNKWYNDFIVRTAKR
jgi:hypothetical protein